MPLFLSAEPHRTGTSSRLIVLVRMAAAAERNGVLPEEQRKVRTVSAMTGRAGEIGMRRVATLLAGLGAARVVTGEADALDLAMEKGFTLAAVGVVAGGAVRTARSHVGKGRALGRVQLVFVASTAKPILALDESKRPVCICG